MPELTEGKEACFFVGNLKQLHLSLLLLSFPGHEISFLNFFDCQVNSRCLINTRESTFNRGLQKAKDQVFLLIAHMPSHPELSSVYPSRLFCAHTKIEELGRESSPTLKNGIALNIPCCNLLSSLRNISRHSPYQHIHL